MFRNCFVSVSFRCADGFARVSGVQKRETFDDDRQRNGIHRNKKQLSTVFAQTLLDDTALTSSEAAGSLVAVAVSDLMRSNGVRRCH